MSEENVLFAKQSDTPPAEEIPAESQSDKYLICVSDSLLYGIDAEQVVEIMNAYSATYLPMMPSYIQGVFNMRGQIIPIMDIRRRLGKPPMESENLLVVLNYNGTQLGILVDSVEVMLDIPNASILPIPSQSAQKLVSGMCTLPDGSGTMLVLDCDQLIPHE